MVREINQMGFEDIFMEKVKVSLGCLEELKQRSGY